MVVRERKIQLTEVIIVFTLVAADLFSPNDEYPGHCR